MFKFCKEGRLHSISTSKCFTTSRNIRRPFVVPIKHRSILYVSCFDIFLDPIRFGDVGQKSPGKKFPQNNRQRKFTKDLLRFGSGRDQTTVLVEGYPVWRCSILLHPSCVHIQCSSMALFDLFVGLLREIQEGSYIIAISAKCMRARHVEGHPVSPAVD